LIDYFADITFLRNADDDQSESQDLCACIYRTCLIIGFDIGINFQKASCTLDGCVKVWTSRVDSVATETGKLLSGLSTGRQNDSGQLEEDIDGDAAEDDDGDGQKKKQKKSRSGESTLAKSFDALKVKKLDLEFTVDPLFKKTSADFDEGGAMGLLMNHLGVDGKCRVVFDAGDVGFEDDDEEEEEEANDVLVDLEKLRGEPYFRRNQTFSADNP
jgi:condensin complex subunit 2